MRTADHLNPQPDAMRASAHPLIRRPLPWLFAALATLGVNLALFALMPYLIRPSEQKPVFEKRIPQISLIRVKRPETPVQRRPAEPPATPPKVTPAPRPDAGSPARAPDKLHLAFEINPRLTGGPPMVEAPPVRSFDFSRLAAIYDPSEDLGSTEVVPVSGAVDAKTLDQPLTALSRLPPVYPISAKRRGIEGWVRLRFVVDPRGEVQEVTVIEAKPKGVFEESVLRSVRSWRFKPGTVNGHPVSARAETTVRFDLE